MKLDAGGVLFEGTGAGFGPETRCSSDGLKKTTCLDSLANFCEFCAWGKPEASSGGPEGQPVFQSGAQYWQSGRTPRKTKGQLDKQ